MNLLHRILLLWNLLYSLTKINIQYILRKLSFFFFHFFTSIQLVGCCFLYVQLLLDLEFLDSTTELHTLPIQNMECANSQLNYIAEVIYF